MRMSAITAVATGAVLSLGLSATTGVWRRSTGRLQSAPPAVVEYAGCSLVREGPVCVVPPERRLVLWIEAGPEAGHAIRVDGRSARLVEVPVSGGRRLEVHIPAGAGRLTVVDARGGEL